MTKEIVYLSVYAEEEKIISFRKAFLESLPNDGIKIKRNKLYMETSTKIYCIDAFEFSLIWNPTFEHIFKNDIPIIRRKNRIKESTIMEIYAWSSPIFDEFPVHVRGKEKCWSDFKDELASDKEYFDIVRTCTLNAIESSDIEKRKDYIDRFISFGILNEEDKILLQYYAMYSPEALTKLFEEKNFSSEDKMEVICQVFVQERQRQQKRKKGNSNSRIVTLVNLLEIPQIIDIFVGGVLKSEELANTRVTKNDLLNVPYVDLIEILSDKNDLLPKELKITSRDLLNEYGRTRNGNEIFKIAKYGYIEPQDLIEVYEINKVLRRTGYEDSIFEDKDLSEYYTPEVLVQMKRNGVISPRFIQIYLELCDFENNPELFKSQSQALVTELGKDSEGNDEKNNNVENDILDFLNIGLCDIETAKLYISEEFIEEKYLNNEITIEQIMEYYKRSLISSSTIAKYYSETDIIELYEEGTLDGSTLEYISNTDLLMEKFVDGRIADEDFIMSYLNGNLSIEDFRDAIELSEKELDISSFIDENTSVSKIKELFLNYLIDYASLIRLNNQGIIDSKEFEDIKYSLNMQEFFEELKKRKKFKVVTSRKAQSNPKERGEVNNVKETRDMFADEILLISSLLNKDVENEPFSLIASHNLNGRPTSLNNYRIFGNEDLDGIIVLQKSKKENSVYVMSALQMMYFLRGRENEDGDIEVQNRMRDKAYLKTIEGVEVVEHTEYFARNLVEAASKVSPKIAERVKLSDREYISEVDKMVTNMRIAYRESKQKGRDEE